MSDFDGDRIQYFDADGGYKGQWGTSGLGPGQFNGPNDIAFSEAGLVFVTDHNSHRVQVFDSVGGYKDQFGNPGSGDGQFSHPAGIDIDRYGSIYVADFDNDRVQVFDPDGSYRRQWGQTGSADGKFDRPTGLRISHDDLVYVADSGNDRIQVFDLDGVYMGQWGSAGGGSNEYSLPYLIDIDGGGDLFVAEHLNDRVQKTAPDSSFETTFGSLGAGNGEFDMPWGVAANQWRQIYVTDHDNDRVQRFFSPVVSTTLAVAGADRFETAAAVSQQGYPRGLRPNAEGQKTVIVATGRNWPDALGGSALAGVLDAPILLVEPNSVPVVIENEIDRLGANKVIVLGGESAVSSSTADRLLSRPGVVQLERIGGVDRYETANKIAHEVVVLQGGDWDEDCFLSTGLAFPDALAASPIAAARKRPVYLTTPDGLTAGTKTAMQAEGAKHAVVLGGSAAVSNAAQAQADSICASGTTRVWGSDRYATAVEVAEYGIDEGGLTMARTALATGRNFPDALSGGALQGRHRSVLLLTGGTTLENVVRDELTTRSAGVYELRYFGGLSVLSTEVRDAAEATLY